MPELRVAATWEYTDTMPDETQNSGVAPEGDNAAKERARAERRERERQQVVESVAAASPTTLTLRVAAILNSYPETRNSDIALQQRYWRIFDNFHGDVVSLDDLYRLTRLTSLSRARAHIQNELNLFLADEEVRRRRGTLSEDHLTEAREQRNAAFPSYAVYLDESGKTQPKVVIGSLWCLDAGETIRLVQALTAWRAASGFTGEIHFKEVTSDSLEQLQSAIDLVMSVGATVGFKYLAMPRAGSGNASALVNTLMYHLVAEGVDHEHRTGRAPLPRGLHVVKDAEDEASRDQLIMAEIRERLRAASVARFGGQLHVESVEAHTSKANLLIQITDLFTSSVNRIVNPPPSAPRQLGPKDLLARYVVERVGLPDSMHLGDLAVEIKL